MSLSAAGLVLGPRAVERPRDAGWALVATLDGRHPARVDWAGLVSPGSAGQADGGGGRWSIDWWIGGDDRWYLPAREPTIRQRRLGAGPVLETSVRIPSGDARHLAYGVLVGGREATVVEIHNDSPVPVALALAVRPYGVGSSGVGSSGVGPADPDAEGPGGEELLAIDGTMVTVGEHPLLVLPRIPGHAGAAARRDLLAAVEGGEDLAWDRDVAGPGANAVVLFPLPHRTSLRFLVLAPDEAGTGAGGGAVDRSLDPRQAPDAEQVARGWNAVVGAATRFELPDPGLTALLNGARARLLLAAPGLGDRLIGLEPGSGAVLAGLAAGGHRREVAAALEAVASWFPTGRTLDPVEAAEVVAALPLAAALLDGATGRPDDQRARLVETAAQLTRLIERQGQPDEAAASSSAVSRSAVSRSAVSRSALARLARPLDPDGADLLAAEAPRARNGGRFMARLTGRPRTTDPVSTGITAGSRGGGPTATVVSGRSPAAGPNAAAADDTGAPALAVVNELAATASPAGVWGGSGGDDAAAAGRFMTAVRHLVVDDAGPDLVLLPELASSWRGGGVEVHDAPTEHGPVSFAVRWHGYRPALLWQFDEGRAALRVPALDAGWTNPTPRGETLLTGSADELPSAPQPGDSFS